MRHMIHTNCLPARIGLLTLLVVSTTAGGAAWAQTRLYVDDDADPGGDGVTWATAYDDLRSALDWAFVHPEVDEIRVACGTYYPDYGTGFRDWTFHLLNDLALYGGYHGIAPCDPNDPNYPCDPNDRDIHAFETILSGEIGSPDVTTDNSYHVVTGTGTDSTAIIDGFTITAGRADGSDPHDDGAGLVNRGGSPVISNCRFDENYATYDGAGMLYLGEQEDLVLAGCTFTDNWCGVTGAGAAIENVAAVSVTDSTFSDNVSNGNVGGGVAISNADSATVTRCTFLTNSAHNQGGGLRSSNAGPLDLTDCLFNGNSVSTGNNDQGCGGAVHCDVDIAADNCTFTSNSAFSSGNYVGYSGRGGAMYTYGSMVLTGCTFTDNTAQGNDYSGDWKGMGGAVFAGSSVTATDCAFMNNLALAWGGNVVWSGRGGAILTNTAIVTRCTFDENRAMYTDTDTDEGCAQGGAICTTALEATDCTFTTNYAWHSGEWRSKGGAVYATSATLEECSFTTNSASGSGSYDGYGGAVYIGDGSTVATNCQFEANSADYQGGAMFLYDASDIITDCTFTGNVAVNGGGGAIHRYTDGEDPGRASNCLFLTNVCGGNGGAIRNCTSTFDLDHCDFEGNAAASSGGALHHDGTAQAVASCTFIDNSSELDGGAILLDEGCSPMIANCRFHGNAAVGCGGALACTDASSPIVVNSILTGNQANLGGAVYCFSSSDAMLVDSTFYCNAAVAIAGALYHDSSLVSICNCILRNDSPNEVYPLTSQVEINYCDIDGGWPYGEGNIDEDPLFVDADGEDDICGTEDDNPRLLPGSPCIDAGDNTRVPADAVDLDVDLDASERVPLDLDCIRRFTDCPGNEDTGIPDPPDYPQVVDLGAYEYGVFGDLDGDCDVDLADLAQLLGSYGEMFVGYDHGDLEPACCDGDVDLADLAALLGAYGDECEERE